MRGTWPGIPVIQKKTALPARRIVSFDVEPTDDSKRIAFEVWEMKEGKVIPLKSDEDEGEDEDETAVKPHRDFE